MASHRILLSLFVFVLQLVGSLQETDTRCVGQLDIVLAVDGSNSMREDNFNNQRKSIIELVQSLDIDFGRINVGAVLFSSTTQYIPIQTNAQTLIDDINKWEYPDGGTNTHLAIEEARKLFKMDTQRSEIPKLLLIITDGQSNDRQKSVNQANLARSEGVTVFAIGVTNLVDDAELKEIAAGSKNVIITEDFSNLKDILNEATSKACTSLVTTPEPTTTADCADTRLDLAFLLDSSFSVSEASFNLAKDYVKMFLNFATIGSDNFRVALVTYSSRAVIHFDLLRYRDRRSINDAIDRIRFEGGTANMADALATLRNDVFTKATGDRLEAANVVIAVIGSNSNVDQDRTIPEGVELRKAGVQVYAIGVGLSDTFELDRISSLPLDENRFTVAKAQDLTTTINIVFNQFNRFCETPQPPPVCYFGLTDITLVVDMSNATEVLSREFAQYDFGLLTKSLTKFMAVVQNPSVSNLDTRMGLIAFSDTARSMVSTLQSQSVSETARAIATLPNVIAASQSKLANALKLITQTVQPGRVSYVVIMTPVRPQGFEFNQVNTEVQRVKNLGYTVVTMPIIDLPRGYDPRDIFQFASNQQRDNFNTNGYRQLTASLYDFTRRSLCGGPRPTTPAPTTPPTTQGPTPFPTIDPNILPACYFGTTDVILLMDVSTTARQLSNSYATMKNSLNQFMRIIQNPAQVNNDIRMGFIPYSDNAVSAVSVGFNSVGLMAQAIANINNNSFPGGSNVYNALRQVTARPRQGEYNSYIIIITPTSPSSFQMNQIRQEVQRVKTLGYKVVAMPIVTGSNTINAQDVLQLASGQKYQFQASSYTNLQRSFTDFANNVLCAGPKGTKEPGLCAGSGHKQSGNAYVAFPDMCDQYVQCYYKEDGDFDLSVIRTCPHGLFWNDQTKKCVLPKDAQCAKDPCKDKCSPYVMMNNCRGYYVCKDDVSTPMCCPKMHVFVDGMGCVMDKEMQCNDKCYYKTEDNKTLEDPMDKEKHCKTPYCKKKPSWKSEGSFYFTTMNMWFGKPCFGEMNFDALTCKCSAPKGHECEPDYEINFNEAQTVQKLRSGAFEGVSLNGVTFDNNGVTVASGSGVHVDVMSKMENEPLTIKFRYRESNASQPSDAPTVLMSSSVNCSDSCHGNVIVYLTRQSIMAVFTSSDGHYGQVEIATKGLSAKEVKEFTLVYDDGLVAMSVKGEYQQYLQMGKVTKGLFFPCGFDFGSTDQYDGFKGTLQMVAVSSCTPAKLH